MSKTESTQTEESLSTDEEIIRKPDKLARRLRNAAESVLGRPRDEWSMTAPDDLAGQCYQVSEAYYHGVDDDRRERLTPHQVTFEVEHFLFDESVELSHWFLKSDSGIIIDLTADQFEGMSVDVPYDQATGRGFVPPSPSKASRKLLSAVKD